MSGILPTLKSKNHDSEPDIYTYTSYDKRFAGEVLRLFLYVDSYEALKDILVNRRLRVSFPWRTNDISEGVLKGNSTLTEETKEKGYICFSATCESPAMWGYYANRGKGFCLVFDFEYIKTDDGCYEVIYKGFSSNLNKTIIHPVKYSLERANIGEDTAALFVKGKEWEHEREYRVLFTSQEIMAHVEERQNEKGSYNYYVKKLIDNLSGIIIGANCSQSQIADIQALLHQAGQTDIGVYRTSLSKDYFKLDKPAMSAPIVSVDFEYRKMELIDPFSSVLKTDYITLLWEGLKSNETLLYFNEYAFDGTIFLFLAGHSEKCAVFQIFLEGNSMKEYKKLEVCTQEYSKELCRNRAKNAVEYETEETSTQFGRAIGLDLLD